MGANTGYLALRNSSDEEIATVSGAVERLVSPRLHLLILPQMSHNMTGFPGTVTVSRGTKR